MFIINSLFSEDSEYRKIVGSRCSLKSILDYKNHKIFICVHTATHMFCVTLPKNINR